MNGEDIIMNFLPIAIVFGVLIFFILCAITLYVYHRRLNAVPQEEGVSPSPSPSLWASLLRGESFESVYGANKLWNRLFSSPETDIYPEVVLFCWRVMCFLFFSAVPFLWRVIDKEGFILKFFTYWNIVAISVYYGLLSFASAIGLVFHRQLLSLPQEERRGFWSERTMYFGYFLQIVYEVLGATALFITVVAYGAIKHDFFLWNTSLHFATSISFLVDGALNNMRVRSEHLMFNLCWILLYMTVTWIIVPTGVVRDWPYFFLETSSATVFMWYIVLFIINIIFYSLWIAYDRLWKEFIPNSVYGQSDESNAVMSPSDVEQANTRAPASSLDPPNSLVEVEVEMVVSSL